MISVTHRHVHSVNATATGACWQMLCFVSLYTVDRFAFR